MPYRDSVSNFAQAYLEAIQDKETRLLALQINRPKNIMGAAGGFSQRGHWGRHCLNAVMIPDRKRARYFAGDA
jgi:hypothetical protein